MRLPLACLAAALSLTACGSVEYKDTRAEVARDPRCIDRPSHPGATPAPWCQPTTGANITLGSGKDQVDFGGKAGKKDQ